MNTELPPPTPAPAEKNTLALLSLVFSFFGCCVPVGLVSVALGFLAIKNAKDAGRERPLIAVIGIVISVLNIIAGVGLIAFAMKQDAEREKEADDLRGKLKGKLDAAALDQQTACDLARLYFLGVKKETAEELRCDGPFEAGDIAKLSNVYRSHAGEDETSTFCYAKANRWYVLSVPGDGVCPSSAPGTPATKPVDEEAFQKQEEELREEVAKARAREVIERFKDRVFAMRDALDKPHGEKKCPSFKSEMKVSYVDANRILDGESVGVQEWDVLSHEDWRTALDEKEDAIDRAEAIDNITRKGDLVAIFDADGLREWPVAEGDSYTMGAYEGWLTLVKLPEGDVVCDSELKFESAETVGGGIKLKGMPDKSTKELIDDDFEDRFEDAATATAKKMGGGKLKLGLKFAE